MRSMVRSMIRRCAAWGVFALLGGGLGFSLAGSASADAIQSTIAPLLVPTTRPAELICSSLHPDSATASRAASSASPTTRLVAPPRFCTMEWSEMYSARSNFVQVSSAEFPNTVINPAPAIATPVVCALLLSRASPTM